MAGRRTGRRTGGGRPAPAPALPPAAPAPLRRRGPCAAPRPRWSPRRQPRRVSPPASATTSVSLSKIRKLTGSHMVMSKSVSPHAFSVVEVDYANVDAHAQQGEGRVEGNARASASPTCRSSPAPWSMRSAEFPHLNASVGDDELVVHNFIDIGIAVDLDYQGLLVPVVRGAETKRLRAIAREINDLADRARTRKLSPDEITGGTFTITNNGSAGSVLTMPIINQPQVAILSTDAIVRKPVVASLPDGGEAIVIHPVGNLAMSWDHRAFDGAYAAGFLVRIKESSRPATGWRSSDRCRWPLRVRWLGRVPYREALAVQQALFDHGARDHLLLLEHPHVFTHGPRADLATNVLVDPASVGAELVAVKRGGDVTYHGPGQLVGYPIVNVPNSLGASDHVVRDPAARRRHARRARRRRRRLPRRVPRRVGRGQRADPAQDLRHRRAARARPHDARLRPQRAHRHALPARLHRAVRHRRQAGHVAGRGGRRRHAGGGGRHRRPPCRGDLGRRHARASGRRLEAPCPTTWRRSPVARARARSGASAGAAGGRRCGRRAHDRDPQARVAAPEGAARQRTCWR